MRNFVQFASDKVYFCSALLNTLLQITPPTAPLPPLILDFMSNMKKPITPCGLSIYKHFDTEWGVHFRAPKDDLQLAAAVVFQPDF